MRSCWRSPAATRSSSIFKPRRIADANAYRLVHGAADGAPGLYVDQFADVLLVQADSSAVLETWRQRLRDTAWPQAPTTADPTTPVAPAAATGSATVIGPASAGGTASAVETSAAGGTAFATAYGLVRPRERRGGGLAPVLLWGDPRGTLTVHERGVRYEVRPAAGPSPGLFLDMREVRSWVRAVAKGREVLNLFAYTCSFGVVAALGGAVRVVNLDLSRPALEWGKRNYARNGLSVEERDFLYGDALDWLARFGRRGQQFDLVIVDPPSFSTAHGQPFAVEQDYTRLVALAARTVSPGGMLLAATNHAGTTDARFATWLRSGLDTAGRHGHLLQRWHEPTDDFPPLAGRPPYLKVRALTLD